MAESHRENEERYMPQTKYTRAAFVFGIFVLGCSSCTNYTVNNVGYDTREAAGAALRQHIERSIAGVPTASKKVGGKLLVVIPTRPVIEDRAVGIIRSHPANIFAADQLEMGFLSIPDAIRKAQLFDSVTVVRYPNAEAEPFDNYDYKLWLLRPSVSVDLWRWYLSKTGFDSAEPVIEGVDRGFRNAELFNVFNTRVVRAAATLDGRYAGESGRRPRRAKGEVISTGSGFFINGNGFALTNAHVVAGCGALRALLREGDNPPMTLVADDPTNDLALLKIASRIDNYALFRAGPPLRQGESIVTYGYPLLEMLAAQGNIGTGVVSALAGFGNDSGNIQISAPVQPGNSGGPVFDEGGNVVGVVRSKLNVLQVAKGSGDIAQNVNFAIKVNIVTGFLEVNNVKYETSILKKAVSNADIADKAKLFTFVVQCIG